METPAVGTADTNTLSRRAARPDLGKKRNVWRYFFFYDGQQALTRHSAISTTTTPQIRSGPYPSSRVEEAKRAHTASMASPVSCAQTEIQRSRQSVEQ